MYLLLMKQPNICVFNKLVKHNETLASSVVNISYHNMASNKVYLHSYVICGKCIYSSHQHMFIIANKTWYFVKIYVIPFIKKIEKCFQLYSQFWQILCALFYLTMFSQQRSKSLIIDSGRRKYDLKCCFYNSKVIT